MKPRRSISLDVIVKISWQAQRLSGKTLAWLSDIVVIVDINDNVNLPYRNISYLGYWLAVSYLIISADMTVVIKTINNHTPYMCEKSPKATTKKLTTIFFFGKLQARGIKYEI